MVAIGATEVSAARGHAAPWALASVAAVCLSLVLRVMLVPLGEGGLPGLVMLVVLSVGAWLAGWLLRSPRAAFVAVAGVGALVNIAALQPRALPEYDDRFAYFTTDQPIEARVQLSAVPATPVLLVLVEPVFAGAQPRFGLAGTVGTTQAAWACPFARGMQRLAMPLPAGSMSSPGEVPVRLRLTGSPSRESDYLLVYSSSRQPGLLVSLLDTAALPATVTRCSLQ